MIALNLYGLKGHICHCNIDYVFSSFSRFTSHVAEILDLPVVGAEALIIETKGIFYTDIKGTNKKLYYCPWPASECPDPKRNPENEFESDKIESHLREYHDLKCDKKVDLKNRRKLMELNQAKREEKEAAKAKQSEDDEENE